MTQRPFTPIFQFNLNNAPIRDRPAEYIPPIPGFLPGYWVQNGQLRKVKKPHYHYIWPKDGKRGNKWGRMKDILQGKGPDIHVTISADKQDYMHNRQRRPRWSNWTDLDPRGPDGALNVKWEPNRKYDFKTRKYGVPNSQTWTDAIYQGPNKNTMWPDQLRDIYGNWWSS